MAAVPRRPLPRSRSAGTPRPLDTRSPRYRLLAAAARLAETRPEVPSVSFEMNCPACGQAEIFTQRMLPTGPEYAAEEHDCL